MVFSSMVFLWIFLPAVLLTYFICPKKFRNGLLIFFSLLFYAWGEPRYVILMILSVTVNYIGGLLLEKEIVPKKSIVAGVVTVNLFLLGYFKYFGFLLGIWNEMLHAFGKNGVLVPEIALPVGISFYTFQALSYVIDVYRGEVKAQHNYGNLLLYVSFFPQLIAGPIVKYKDINAQIIQRNITVEKFGAGAMRFCWGLGKKVLLANAFAKVVDDIYANNLEMVSRKALWLGALLYMLQIYYDFSGYSDMAIGLGKMFGFDFLENFRYPYLSTSVREFWRRWHISLSSWFRDYVYIPLGGSRAGKKKTYRNLLIVFFLTGLWHGAGVTFILWGLYHGFFLILERAWLGKRLEKLPKAAGWCYTGIITFWGWILFRTESLSTLAVYVRNMFVEHPSTVLTSAYLDKKMVLLLVLGILFSGIVQKIYESSRKQFPQFFPKNGVVTVPRMTAALVLFWLSAASLVGNSYNPFIYFRF